MSAFGGKADISRTLNELFLSYVGLFPIAALKVDLRELGAARKRQLY